MATSTSTFSTTAFVRLWKKQPIVGEKLTLGTREFEVLSVNDETYEVRESFFQQSELS